MVTIKVGRRGQITLPSAIRRKMGINEGDHIAVVTLGDRLVLHPINQTLLDLRGSVPVSAEQDFGDIRQQVMRKRATRLGSSDG